MLISCQSYNEFKMESLMNKYTFNTNKFQSLIVSIFKHNNQQETFTKFLKTTRLSDATI